MKDEEIRRLLLPYVQAEMDLIRPEQMPGYGHVYSRSYAKRIKRLFWSEKYFGARIRLGYVARYVAMAVLAILCLWTAGKVSAEVFGFDLWGYVMSFVKKSQSEVRTYTQKSGGDEQEKAVPMRDIPEGIPEGAEQTIFEKNKDSLFIQWNLSEESGIQYTRTKINDGLSVLTDGAYDSKEEVQIHGLPGYYYIKDKESWLLWDDSVYRYHIDVMDISSPKQTLLDMAESLYVP